MHQEGRVYTYSLVASVAHVKFPNTITDRMYQQWEQKSISVTNLTKDRRILNSKQLTYRAYLGPKTHECVYRKSENVSSVRECMAFLFLLGYLVLFMLLYMHVVQHFTSEDILDDEFDHSEVRKHFFELN